jgi:cyclomaltodextrinase / maltogenic alpha-amylase / neopullulanase
LRNHTVQKIFAFLVAMSAAAAVPAPAQPASFVPAWVRDAVFYQIFPERFANGDATIDPPGTLPWSGVPTSRSYFGGDIRGIIDHLDYVCSLGVTALYLNPVFASGTNHKYQTRDYLTIDPAFGDERVLKELIDTCHARGLRVILDGVFNHTGVDFFAFADVKKRGAASPYRDWYFFRGFPVGPPSAPNYECWWSIGNLPKLNTGNPEVRRYLFEVTRHWTELGIDGWRLDVPNEIPHEFWIEWRRLVRSINPEAYIVGEIWDNGASWLRGDQFDAVMNYRFRSACVDFFAARTSTVAALDSALRVVRGGLPEAVNLAAFNLLGSHDTERFLTLCGGDEKRWKLGMIFLLTYPGVPCLYYGDEVGMSGGKDPACRGPMIWEESKQNRQMLDFTRKVIALRRRHTVLRRGAFEPVLVDDTRRLYAFLRREGEAAALVVLNASVQDQTVTLPGIPGAGGVSWRQVWPGEGTERAATIAATSAHVYIGAPTQ